MEIDPKIVPVPEIKRTRIEAVDMRRVVSQSTPSSLPPDRSPALINSLDHSVSFDGAFPSALSRLSRNPSRFPPSLKTERSGR